MITNLNGKQYSTDWEYTPTKRYALHRSAEQDIMETTCRIWPYDPSVKREERKAVAMAWAHQAPSDIHCKETARKISFGRALQQMNLSRDERRVFWNSYFGRKAVAAG